LQLLLLALAGARCALGIRSAAPTRLSGEFRYLQKIGPGFWNIRTPFEMFNFQVGTHMSLAELSDGNFVAIDTVDLSMEGLKEEIDLLTDNGKKITAVLGTHPFHTLFFPGFHDAYPATASRQYFGMPRHLRKVTGIAWSGPITSVFDKWPELEMLIPEGGEYDDPKPEKTNHLMNAFVFHKPSKTVHNDDCVYNIRRRDLGWVTKFLSLFLKAVKPGMHFHPSLTGPGLYHTPEAPLKFQASIEKILTWDFENLCTAHNSNSIGTAKEELRKLLNRTTKKLRKLSKKYAKGEKPEKMPDWSDKDGGECG